MITKFRALLPRPLLTESSAAAGGLAANTRGALPLLDLFPTPHHHEQLCTAQLTRQHRQRQQGPPCFSLAVAAVLLLLLLRRLLHPLHLRTAGTAARHVSGSGFRPLCVGWPAAAAHRNLLKLLNVSLQVDVLLGFHLRCDAARQRAERAAERGQAAVGDGDRERSTAHN